MKNTLHIITFLFLSILNGNQNTDTYKITLSKEVQDYLFSTQDILEEYIKIQDEIFSPLKDTLDYRDYKSLSNQLIQLNNNLIENKSIYSKTIKNNLSDRENILVNVMNTYVEKLSRTILQLSYVSSRLKGVFSYSPNEYSNDIEKFSELREDYLGHGEILNELLEIFLITHPTRKK